MNYAEYEGLLRKRLGTYFDFKTDVSLDGRTYPLVAEHTARLEQTVLGKDNVVDFFDTREFCVLSRHASANAASVAEELERAKSLVSVLAKPCRTHKSTMITRILAVENPRGEPPGSRADADSLVRSFKHTKPHKFYFHGWSEVRVFVVYLPTAEVVASPRGKRDRAAFVPIA